MKDNEDPQCPTVARLPCWHTASPSGHCLWLTEARCQNCQQRPFNFPVIVLLLLTSPSVIFCKKGKRVSQMLCSSQFYQAGRFGWFLSNPGLFFVDKLRFILHIVYLFSRADLQNVEARVLSISSPRRFSILDYFHTVWSEARTLHNFQPQKNYIN